MTHQDSCQPVLGLSQVEDAVQRVFSLFRTHGNRDYIGEKVSQVEHMLQCAMLAEQENQKPEVVLAALFHDIGHLLAYEDATLARMAARQSNSNEQQASPAKNGRVLGVQRHEEHGARFLEGLGFPKIVCSIVEAHVAAKRYLVYADPQYEEKLSDSSRATLRCQGGPMLEEEARRFEREAFFQAAVRLRHWDDKAKVVGVRCTPLEKYEDMCRSYLRDIACA